MKKQACYESVYYATDIKQQLFNMQLSNNLKSSNR